MRRLASAFLTLWLIAFAPSLGAWGLFVRSGQSGADRFASVWHWFADLLAFPLLLTPLTDWSWRALDGDTWWTATLGFVVLCAVWAAMFALPLAVVSGWWRWVGNRLAGNQPHSATEDTDSAYAGLPIPGRVSSSPFAGLYVVTIPLALGFTAVKGVVGVIRRVGHPIATFVRPFALTCGAVLLLITGLFAVSFGMASHHERLDLLLFVIDDVWYGYLDALKIPRIFHDRWTDAAATILRAPKSSGGGDGSSYLDQWYRHEEFRTLLWVTAARHALGVVVLVAAWKAVRRVF